MTKPASAADASPKAPPRSNGGALKLAVGDLVVYSAHGVGRVVARERTLVGGAERDCVLVDLAAGLRVTLPIEVATGRLRALANEAEFKYVKETLAAEPGTRDGSWTRRIKENTAKLVSGGAVELAELVRDGAPYEAPAGGVSRLSAGERRLYLQARQLLAREICSARGVEQVEADAWIEAQLALPSKDVPSGTHVGDRVVQR
jgi:CarD family transcriptional regulator